MSVTKRIASRARTSKGSHHCTLFGLAPDGVYQADRVTSTAGALLPHRFTLTTRQSRSSMNDDLVGPFGGLFSVALSLASRPVDVIDHPILRSPDFPPVCPKALQRSSCPLTAIAQNDRSTRSRQGSSLECLPSLWIMIEPARSTRPPYGTVRLPPGVSQMTWACRQCTQRAANRIRFPFFLPAPPRDDTLERANRFQRLGRRRSG